LPCLSFFCVLSAGHFFHIDYGFLFGRDPKPFRPLVRFTSEMLAALGGSDHTLYQEFLELACRCSALFPLESD
jgi:phosphatidylinositol 3-kinase